MARQRPRTDFGAISDMLRLLFSHSFPLFNMVGSPIQEKMSHRVHILNRQSYHALAESNAFNKSTSIDLTKSAAVRHKDRNAHDPHQAHLSKGPNSPDAIANYKGTMNLSVIPAGIPIAEF